MKTFIKKYFCLFCCLIVCTAFAGVFAACKQEEPPLWASCFELPSEEDAMARVLEIYGSEEQTFLLQSNRILRMPCPENGETVTINVACEFNQFAKLVLEDSVEEFNDVFKVINPNYEFAVNYSPSEEDFAQQYSVKLTSAKLQSSSTSMTLGQAPHSYYGSWIGDFRIVLDEKTLTNGYYLMTTFKHELMHLLGAGDAYKNSYATKDTVMQSYSVNGYHNLSSIDVAFLDALYRNAFAPYSQSEISDFIENYEENTPRTKINNISRVYRRLIENVTAEQFAAQLSEIGYADCSGLLTQTSKGILPDPSFGASAISFTELDFSSPQSETYFGAINPDSGYTHGRAYGGGSSSFTIPYTDYGNGILYSAPNGGNYTILICTGSYVLLFRLGGGYSYLNTLSLDLWHACSC